MSRHRFLYLDDHGLRVYAVQRKHLAPEGCFADEPEGHAQFARYVGVHRNSGFSLLVHPMDEQQTLIRIPRLRRNERHALLERRGRQLFADGSPRQWIALDRAHEDAHQENILMTALTAGPRLQTWATCLRETGANLRGLYSPGQLLGPLLARHLPATPAGIVLTAFGSNLYVGWVERKNILASRLFPLTDLRNPAAVTGACRSVYVDLLAQGLIRSSPSIPVLCLMPDTPETGNALPTTGSDPELRFQCIPTPGDGALSCLQLLAQCPPRRQFAPIEWRANWIVSHLRRWLAGLTVVLAGGMAAVAWQASAETQILTEANRLQGLREQAMTAELAGESEHAPPVPSTGTLHPVLSLHDKLRHEQRHPGPFWQVLSQTMNTAPSIRVDELDWKIHPTTASTAEMLSETSTLHGHFDPLERNPLQAMAEFEQLLEQLRQTPSLSVRVLQSPNAYPADLQAGSATLRFAIELSRLLP